MINIKGSYNREFYIFEKVSSKYGIPGKEQSGYLKIEAKGEKGKLKAYVDNITILDNIKYYLKFYVLKDEAKCIKSQIIWPVKGIIKREIDFVCSDFEGTHVSIDSIAVVAVIAEKNMADGQISKDIVLGASKKSIKEWVEIIKKVEKSTEIITASKEITSSIDGVEKLKQTETKEVKEGKQSADKNYSIDYSKDNFNKINSNEINMDKRDIDKIDIDKTDIDKTDIDKTDMDKRDIDKTDIDKIDIDKIGEKFDEYFQKVDPFGTGRRDYEWWWVNNPVFLNNILYDFKIKSPLIFKPEIMDSQFKYKHIIVGIFHDANSDESYFIYGIPGNMDYDKAPGSLHSVWIKAGFDFQGNNTFGYWLIYFEPYSGNIINV